MKRVISMGLILAGVLIILYPTINGWLADREQEKLMASWQDGFASDGAISQYDALTDLFAEEPSEEPEIETNAYDSSTESPSSADPGASAPTAEAAPSVTPQPAAAKPALNAIASISIPSIKLKLPVLEGATQKNMKYAAAHLKETAEVGEIGNAAIAAHRMRAKGKLFNRLDEVEVGDKIVVETKKEKFTYTVYDISIVEPSDVSVLNYNDTDRRLTLITCDPVVNPTHRLIVHAEMS